MKTSFFFLLLLGVVLPLFASSEEIEVKKREIDIAEEEGEEEEDEGEWDIEKEVFGPQEERYEGVHILDENLNVVISEPSGRVLRAISSPKEEDQLTLEKVKALYREKLERDARKERWLEEARSNGDLLNQNFEQLLAEEQKVTEKETALDDSIIQRVMDFFW